MRKLLAWLLAAMIALSGFAFAEADQPTAQPAVSLEQPTAEDEPVESDGEAAPAADEAPEETEAPEEAEATAEPASEATDLPTEAPAPAQSSAAALSTAYNGRDAVRVGKDLYFAIPDVDREMLVRVPEEGDPVCVDRGDRIEDLMPYAGGAVYLKTENNSSAIMACNGTQITQVYGFGASTASSLNFYDGKLLVLIDGLLHSIEPGTQLCLRMSGSQMLDYVLDGDTAYFLSAGDRMEYTAKLGDGQTVSTQAGCVYSLDLKTGETGLQLKSGVRDLKIAGGKLYFHNLADAYAVRSGETAQLMGRVNGLDLQQHTLGDACPEPDNGFWALDRGLVVWYKGALYTETEAGTLALYSPENGATVGSDGEYLYVWEAGKPALTRVELNGTATVLYSGDLTQARDLSLMVPDASADPNATVDPNATADPNNPAVPLLNTDVDPNGGASWFDEFMDNQNRSSSSSGKGVSSSSSGGSTGSWPGATPIGMTPTPAPVSTPAPEELGGESSGGSYSGGSSSGGSSSSGKSSGSSSSGTYSVSISRVKMSGSVNVRSGPGLGYRVKAVLNKGAVVNCTGRASKDSRGRVWYQVSRNGSTGWVSSLYAKKTTASLTSGTSSSSSGSSSASGTLYTTGSVNIRSGPGLGYSSKGTIGKGKALKVTAKSTDGRGVVWYKTSSGGKTGWVSSRYLSTSKTAASKSSSGSGGYVVTTGKVTIRSAANKSSAAKGYMGKGKKATYLGSAKKDSRGVTWYKISYKGVTGWVSSRYSYRS